MPILSNTIRTTEFMVSEAPGYRSRESVTVDATDAALLPGTVMAVAAEGSATRTANPGNTGNGVLTVDASTPVRPNAQNGTYTVRAITAASNGGTFRVFDPTGDALGDVAVGATFNNQIKFVIADGATDFIVGDSFTILVALAGSSYVRHDLTASDGTEIAVGILWEGIAEDEIAARTLIVRDAEVVAGHLTYSASATDAQKAATNAALSALGIITR